MKKLVFLIIMCMVGVFGAAVFIGDYFWKKGKNSGSNTEPAVRAEYTVTFNTMGGTQIAQVKVLDGNTVERPENPTKDGYLFDSWYYNEDYTLGYNFNAKVHKDLTLFASWYDENLSFVQMPDGSYAVASCDTSATTVDISSVYRNRKVTTIGEKAFKNCTRIEEIVLPNSIESIENNAFLNCGGLRKLTLGSGLSEIAGGAFNGCNALATIDCANNSNYYVENSLLIRNEIWKGSLMYIRAVVFGCGNLTNYTIPNNCQTIEPYAFYGKGLDKIKLGSKMATIGRGAFENCKYLTDVEYASYTTTPLSTISEKSFKNCTALANLNVLFNVTTIGTSAFEGCTSLSTVSFLSNSQLILISSRAFYGCTSLENIKTGVNDNKLPASVSIIDSLAFGNCTSLQTLGFTGASKLNEIGENAFFSCTNLTDIDLPANVSTIKENAFFGCSALRKIVVPVGVTSLGDNAFAYCNELKSIEFMSDDANVVNKLLPSLGKYDEVVVVWESVYNDIVDLGLTLSKKEASDLFNLVLVNGKYSILNYKGSNNQTVVIPSTRKGIEIVSISDEAFKNCTEIAEIILPETISAIGSSAFSGCTGLVAISIPASVESVAGVGFDSCTSLATVSLLSRNNEQVAQMCLELSSQLTNSSQTVEVLRYMKEEIEQNAEANNIAYKIDCLWTIEPIEEVYTFVRGGADENTYYKITEYKGNYEILYIPDEYNGFDVKVLGAESFANHAEITKVVVPSSVTQISEGAFSICSGLAEITLPFVGGSADATEADRTTLFGYIFGTSEYAGATETQQQYASGSNINSNYYIPTSLAKVTITGGNLLYGAFSGCSRLTSVTIGSSVTNIAERAFSGCSGLEEITLPFVGKSSSATGENGLFGYIFGTTSSFYIGIPPSDVLQYFDTGTSFYSSAYAFIPNNLKTVTITGGQLSYGAFSGCSKLTSITLPNTVTSIEGRTFYNCSGLTSITLPNSLTSIGDLAFYNCSALTNISIPNSVSTIGSSAFYDCSNLTSITIPSSVASIGSGAFSGCNELQFNEYDNAKYLGNEDNLYLVLVEAKNTVITSCTISSSTKFIGHLAFYNCSNLASITIPNNVTSIEYGAFMNCSRLTSITLPNSLTSIDNSAFSSCKSLASITIPDSVTTIGEEAFYGCRALASITLGRSVTTIKNKAFSSCYSLAEVINKSSLSIVVGSSNISEVANYAISYAISVVNNPDSENYVSKIYTANDVQYYKEDETNWTAVGYVGASSEIALDDHCTNIKGYAFWGFSGLTSITIPDSVTSIGYYAFWDCVNLTTVIIDSADVYTAATSSNAVGDLLDYAKYVYVLKSVVDSNSNSYLTNTNYYTQTSGTGEWEDYYIFTKVTNL